MIEATKKQRRLAQKRIAKVWRRLNSELDQTLHPGASEQALEALEAHVQAQVPASLRASYLNHDGETAGDGAGLWFGYRWLPLDEVRAHYHAGDALLPFAQAEHSIMGVLLVQQHSHVPGTVLRDGEFYAEDLTSLLQCLVDHVTAAGASEPSR